MSPRRSALIPLLVLALAGWRLHPIHAARVELEVSISGNVNATVHVYRDDLPSGAALPDVAACLDRGLVLTDAHGVRIALRVVTVTAEGDRLRVALVGSAPAGTGRGRIAVSLLQERFADQVNVVEIRSPAGKAQLVFLYGDKPQVLP